jgi:hypothetical protein
MSSVAAAGSPELAGPAAATAISAEGGNAFTPEAPARPARDVAANAFPAPTPPPAAAPAPAPAYAAAAPPAVVAASYHPMPDDGSGLAPLLTTLHDSLYPSQREWAAERLASLDWRRQPIILDALVAAAHDDPAPTVRAECLHSLGRMKANTLAVVSAVEALKNDADPHVRQEAEDTLAELTAAPTPAPK